jgi:hypothetical protein
LREIGLVGGASLADVLDDTESRKTSAYSVDELLVESTGVDTNALHEDWVILGSF